MGRLWARCNLGSDLNPKSITAVTDLGLLGAAIYRAVSWTQRLYAVTRTRRWMSLSAKPSWIAFDSGAINSCVCSLALPFAVIVQNIVVSLCLSPLRGSLLYDRH